MTANNTKAFNSEIQSKSFEKSWYKKRKTWWLYLNKYNYKMISSKQNENWNLKKGKTVTIQISIFKKLCVILNLAQLVDGTRH